MLEEEGHEEGIKGDDSTEEQPVACMCVGLFKGVCVGVWFYRMCVCVCVCLSLFGQGYYAVLNNCLNWILSQNSQWQYVQIIQGLIL